MEKMVAKDLGQAVRICRNHVEKIEELNKKQPETAADDWLEYQDALPDRNLAPWGCYVSANLGTARSRLDEADLCDDIRYSFVDFSA